jgi:hypothetical protein
MSALIRTMRQEAMEAVVVDTGVSLSRHGVPSSGFIVVVYRHTENGTELDYGGSGGPRNRNVIVPVLRELADKLAAK